MNQHKNGKNSKKFVQLNVSSLNEIESEDDLKLDEISIGNATMNNNTEK